MKLIRLLPRSKQYQDQEWGLELGEHRVRVLDPDNEVILGFPRQQASSYFQFPSFWDSIRHFGIRLPNGQVEECDVSPKGMTRIQDYCDGITVEAGPDAIRSYLGWGLVSGIAGVAVAGFGTVGSFLSYQQAAAQPEGGTYIVAWGVVLFGVALMGKGAYNVYQYFRLCKLAETRSANQAKVVQDK